MNRTSQGERETAPSADDRPSLSEDRYRRGTRRTGAEPLAASWEPAGRKRRKRRKGMKGLIASYGWRIYAIPVLLVLTALVVLDTAAPTNTGETDTAADTGTGVTTPPTTTGPPAATEKPPVEVDLKNFPTAQLPDGPKFSEQGVGTWAVIPGSTPQAGTGKLYKYEIAIEDGVEPADYNGDPAAFARTVDGILADPRSWIGTGTAAMQRVEGGDVDFTIALTTTNTAHAMCGFSIQFEASCWHPTSGRVIINAARWVRGAKVYGNDISGYRTYAINHEVGHALKNGHVGCAVDGGFAPVMMQQSFGVANDYVAQLNSVPGGDRNAVTADGKVCKPNPFPVAPQ
ncbi:hypothetical protein ALI22I_25370 [Saccharothrix sp. ALI-22-I]|uniref:DUF3152 domain-containing protein n=1 Tax=Saccharothrix sp. ALI-22-I TaxID=1933778 RepID=UPI00097C4669|nr:DUF3152 domain-containing protein [Saccharothrix sp. ALI-22-I]ONI86072.1 hypothetical protein ALI22I_25370 [Saccharothrix sp. ALI-22-I]